MFVSGFSVIYAVLYVVMILAAIAIFVLLILVLLASLRALKVYTRAQELKINLLLAEDD